VTLRELLEQAASELPGVSASQARDGSATWIAGDRAFVVLSPDGNAAEFALDGPVAVAAARTPDTSPSPRGAGWVMFRPAALDDHAADRAAAWFASAHRRLGRG
jgi:hypothetical protein